MLSVNNIAILVGYLILTISGLMLIKLGGGFGHIGFTDGKLLVDMNFKSILGIALYLFSFLTYIVVVSRFDLSYIVPIINGLVTLFSVILALVLLKEKMSAVQIAGAVIIVLGLILMNLKSGR